MSASELHVDEVVMREPSGEVIGALGIIDSALGTLSARDLVAVDEITDILLDIRSALTRQTSPDLQIVVEV